MNEHPMAFLYNSLFSDFFNAMFLKNLSLVTMRKMVKLTSKILLNPRCPLWLQRKGLNVLGGYGSLPHGISIEKSTLAGREVWWFDFNKTRSQTVILYFHGGGYSIGSPRSHRDLCAHLANYSQSSLLSLDYRLAPEHPYPAATEDTFLAYKALLEMGHQGTDIAVAGDSAGGGLALNLAVQLKHENLPQPACLFLISPLINKKRSTVSYQTQYDVDPVINAKWVSQLTENYLQNSAELLEQACLSEKDIAGIAPMLIHVGTDEVLLDDSLVLKQRAMKSGVKVEMITFPELWHVFHFSASIFPKARAALKQAGLYIQNHFK